MMISCGLINGEQTVNEFMFDSLLIMAIDRWFIMAIRAYHDSR